MLLSFVSHCQVLIMRVLFVNIPFMFAFVLCFFEFRIFCEIIMYRFHNFLFLYKFTD